MTEPFDLGLSNFWDDVNQGRPVSAEQEKAFGDAIQRFTTSYETPVPGAARERARRRVLGSFSPELENTMSATSVPGSFPSPNGRPHAPSALPERRVRVKPRPLWARVVIAAAILLVLGAIGSYLTFVPESDRFWGTGPAPHQEVIPAATLGADWPMYRGNPARTGAQDGSGPKSSPTVLWTFDTGASAFRSPAVAGGIAYAGDSNGVLHALDANTGEEIWTFQGDSSLEMTPAVIGTTVFIPSANGTLYAIDALNGNELWTFEKPLSDFATPSYNDGMLFAGSLDGNLYAIDASSGEEIWHFAANGALSRCTAVADGVVYTGAEDGFLYAIDEKSGKEIWKYDTNQDIVGTPTIANGTVYVAKPGGPLFALNATTGEELFSFDAPNQAGVTPAAVTGSTVFVGSPDASFYGLDATTGELKWSFATNGRITGTPAIVDGVLYGASFDNHIYALDATTGAELWNLPLDGSIDFGPSVANGAVYASTSGGTVYAIGGKSESTESTPAPTAEGTTASVPAFEATHVWSVIHEGHPLQGLANLAIAPDGNVWVLNVQTGRFSIYAPDGTPVGQWGSDGSGDGQFDFALTPDIGAADFAFAPDGSLYVADIHQRVQQFAPDLSFVRSWGSIGRGDGQFLGPVGIAIDGQSNVYVVDGERNDVQKFDANGNHLLTFGAPGSQFGGFSSAASATIGADGTIWVTDRGTNRIEGFSSEGEFLREITNPALSQPAEITTDTEGNLYVVNQGSYRVTVFDPDGNLLASLDGIGDGGEAFAGLDGVAVDDDGNVYGTYWTSPSMQNPSEALQKFHLQRTTEPIGSSTPVRATPVA